MDLAIASPRIADQVRAFSHTGSQVVAVTTGSLQALKRMQSSARPSSVDGWTFQPQLVVDQANIGRPGFALLYHDIAISGTIEKSEEGPAKAKLSYTTQANNTAAHGSDRVSVEQSGNSIKIIGPQKRERMVPRQLSEHVLNLIKIIQSQS